MKPFHILVMSLLLLTIVAGSAYAQQQQGATTSSQGQQTGQSQQMSQPTTQQQQARTQAQLDVIANADKLKGTKVINNQGQDLGKVDHVALDLQNGRISYVALDVGSGKGLIPVPYNRFGVMRNQQLVLDTTKDRLSQAPSFAKGRQPNWNDQNFAQSVSSYWGSAPSGIVTAQAPASPTSSQPIPMSQQPTGTGQQQTPMGSSQQPQQQ